MPNPVKNATVAEMKEAVLAMMKKRYATVQSSYKPADDKEVAAAAFVLEAHAAAIRTTCDKTYMVSFRCAGKWTLERIASGNPCKGHSIMSKSIKERPGGPYTYNILAPTFEKLHGLVGDSTDSGDNPRLENVWAFEPLNGTKKISVIDAEGGQVGCFTGDYDMHDLLRADRTRILPGPDEESVIQALNVSILATDNSRSSRVKASLGIGTGPDVVLGTAKQRVRESQYAVIRHGAQTSYMSFLQSATGRGEAKPGDGTSLPLEAAVTNIDSNICFFDADKKAYILDSVQKIYNFYADRNLLHQIPFYYFFKDLRKNGSAEEKTALDGYTRAINVYMGLIADPEGNGQMTVAAPFRT